MMKQNQKNEPVRTFSQVQAPRRHWTVSFCLALLLTSLLFSLSSYAYAIFLYPVTDPTKGAATAWVDVLGTIVLPLLAPFSAILLGLVSGIVLSGGNKPLLKDDRTIAILGFIVAGVEIVPYLLFLVLLPGTCC